MRKIVTISLIQLLFLSQVGYYFIYTLRQYQIKEEIEKQLLSAIPESLLEMVVTDENFSSIIWEERGKEFLLDGQLYDVAKIIRGKGKTLIYCINDKKEQQLLSDLSKAAKSGNSNKSDQEGRHTIKFQLTYFISANTEKETHSSRIRKQEHIDYAAAIRSFIKEVTSPPPRA